MSIRERFTDDDWFLLGSTPAMIAAAMSTASPGGAIREMVGGMRSTVEGRKTHADSPLISELLARVENWDAAREKARDYRERTRSRIESAGIDSREALLDQVVNDCETVADLLAEHATDADADAYRLWCLDIAREVANAAKEGGFLGFGGQRVSEEEQAMMGRVESALGLARGALPA